MTTAEYFETPETLLPTELIFGVLHTREAPAVGHQRVVFKLARALAEHAEREAGGEVLIAPVDVVLDAEKALILQPDLLYVSSQRDYLMTDRIMGAPDLVIEVLSPRPRVGDLNEKLRWYATYGVPEIWVYHQSRRVMNVLACNGRQIVERISFESQTPIASRVLPGFTRSMDAILGPAF